MIDGQPEPSRRPGEDGEQQAGSAQVPGAAGGSSRRVMLIAATLGLCLVLAGVAIAVFSSPGGGKASHLAGAGNSPAVATPQTARPTAPAAQPTAPAASSRSTPKPGGASDGLAKSVLRWPPGHKRQILRWDAGPGGQALAAVGEQMGTAMQSAGLKQYAPMKLACTQLASDISTAQAGPPIPDAAMQRLYAKTLAGLSHAAADCRTSISIHADGEDTQIHVNKRLLSRSRVEFAAASAKLYRATGEIASLRH
jgi:hypothetical protein